MCFYSISTQSSREANPQPQVHKNVPAQQSETTQPCIKSWIQAQPKRGFFGAAFCHIQQQPFLTGFTARTRFSASAGAPTSTSVATTSSAGVVPSAEFST